MPIIKDPSGAFTALKTGEVDIVARDVPPELRAELGKLPTMKLVQTTPLSVVELKLNFDKPPFDDPKFRQAFTLIVDRQPIVDGVLLGHGMPANQGYTHPNSPWSKPNESDPVRSGRRQEAPGRDPVHRPRRRRRPRDAGRHQARVRADRAGQRAGLDARRRAGLQADDGPGIRLTLQPLDMGTVRRLFSTRAFEVYMAEAGAHAVADPDQFIMSHRSGNLWKTGKPYPEWDALWEEWKNTTDIESRKQVSFRMQALYNKQPTGVPLYYPATTYAFRPTAYDQWQEVRGYGIVRNGRCCRRRRGSEPW